MINYKVKKIMVPYDFSANAEKAISHAAFIASIQKADLYLVHVINKSELVDIILPILKLKSNKVVIDLVNQRLDDVCAKIRKACQYTLLRVTHHGFAILVEARKNSGWALA